LVVFAFYLERVEGIRDARLPLAVGVVLMWWWRAHAHGRASQQVLRALGQADVGASSGTGPLDSLALAGVAGVVLALFLLPAAGVSRVGAVGLVPGLGLAVPVGMLAPAWLVHAGHGGGGGGHAYAAAYREGAGLRGSALLLHGCLLLASALLFVNMLAVVGMALAALQSLVGVEVSALGAFMSFENDFALVATAALTLLAFEPLRNAVALVAFLHARARRDGADLRRMVSALAAASLLCLVVALSAASPARAQHPGEPTDGPVEAPDVERYGAEDPAVVELPALNPEDAVTEEQVAAILGGSEFREFEDARADSDATHAADNWLTRLLEALVRWLEEMERPEGDGSAAQSPMPVPPAWLFVALAAALLVAVGIYLGVAWRREQRARELWADVGGTSTDPRERAPEEHLDEAAQLAAQGLFRQALRCLYLATLVALDRHGQINFDPARTNWHYLRQMGPGAHAASFRTFTRLFDRKWYGDESTSRDEYERARELASALTAPPLRTAASPPVAAEGAS
jgi:hypothetical protein